MEKVARECVEFGEENCSKGKWCRKTGRVVYPRVVSRARWGDDERKQDEKDERKDRRRG